MPKFLPVRLAPSAKLKILLEHYEKNHLNPYSLAIGGTLLVLPGIFLGGEFPMVTATGCLYLVLLIAISTMGFTLYNKLLTCNPVGKVAIYNSLIPVVGAVTSCLCLDEQFQIKYVIAGALAATGIYIINRSK